jgi:crotonobetainyl-CoA:carnitine CoA-transferase CaiB-like acyl-CoA transferase
LALSGKANFPLAPVNDSASVGRDPQFLDRLGFIPADRLGAEEMPIPIKLVDGQLAWPEKAPMLGQHTEAVLADVLGYDDSRIESLRDSGAFGKPS